MSLGLEELVTTLAIGVLVLASLIGILYLALGSWLNNVLNKLAKLNGIGGTTILLILLALSFAIGMLAEVLSNRVVDRDQVDVFSSILRTEKELRTSVLFGNADEPAEVKPLARELAEKLLLSAYAGQKGRDVEVAIAEFDNCKKKPNELCEEILPSLDILSSVTTQVYYHAKNELFLHPTYFAELSRIQRRIDFARSLTLISVLLLILLIFTLIFIFLFMLLSWFTRPKTSFTYLNGGLFVLMAFVITSLCFAGGIAFEEEEKEFDKRVFGYISTMKHAVSNGAILSTIPGVSAMLKLSSQDYLIAHDRKSNDPGNRLQILKPVVNGILIEPLKIDWFHPDGPPSDIEALCEIQRGRILLAESGFFTNEGVRRFGRIFEISLSRSSTSSWKGEHTASYTLPQDTVNIEGILCGMSDGRKEVILGERGGDGDHGALRYGIIDNEQVIIKRNLPFPIENEDWFQRSRTRVIADLFKDDKGQIWAVGTRDPGDNGPFESMIYRLGGMSSMELSSFQAVEKISEKFLIPGFKIEAIAQGPSEGQIAIASDDENLGAAWRVVVLE